MTSHNKVMTAFTVSVLSVMMVGGMNTVYAQETPEQEAEIERLLNQWLDLYDQKQESIENPPAKRSLGQLTQVDRDMNLVWSQYESLEAQIPKPQLADISPEMEQKMETIMDRLEESNFPIVTMGIDYTGELNIGVDRDLTQNIDEEIIKFVNDPDITIDIGYQINQGNFQTKYCNTDTKKCNPVIAGAVGEENTFFFF